MFVSIKSALKCIFLIKFLKIVRYSTPFRVLEIRKGKNEGQNNYNQMKVCSARNYFGCSNRHPIKHLSVII